MGHRAQRRVSKLFLIVWLIGMPDAMARTPEVTCPSSSVCVTKARRDSAIHAFLEVDALRETIKVKDAARKNMMLLHARAISSWEKRYRDKVQALEKRRQEDRKRLTELAKKDAASSNTAGFRLGLTVGLGVGLGVTALLCVVILVYVIPKGG